MKKQDDDIAWAKLCKCESQCRKSLEDLAAQEAEEHSTEVDNLYTHYARYGVNRAVTKKLERIATRLQASVRQFFHAGLASPRKQNIEADRESVRVIEERLSTFVEQVFGIRLPLEPLPVMFDSIIAKHLSTEGLYQRKRVKIWGEINVSSLLREDFTRKHYYELKRSMAEPNLSDEEADTSG